MAKARFLNGKGMITEGTLEYQEGGKKAISKNIGKYKSILFFWSFLNCFLTIEPKLLVREFKRHTEWSFRLDF